MFYLKIHPIIEDVVKWLDLCYTEEIEFIKILLCLIYLINTYQKIILLVQDIMPNIRYPNIVLDVIGSVEKMVFWSEKFFKKN